MAKARKSKLKLESKYEESLKKRGFKIGDPINSGSFACVYKATFKGNPCAAKVIDLEKTSEDYRIKFLPREIYTMKKLKHKYLIEIIDIFVVGQLVMVFMELADGGDFLDYLQEIRQALPEETARYFYLQFGDALLYMHNIGFAHRDIKCDNILLNKSRTVSKLTDFGFTRTCVEKQSGRKKTMSDTFCGSAAYVAPEVLKAVPYNPLISDVWSIGVVLFVLLNLKLPFGERDTKKLLDLQLNRNYRFAKPVSKECEELIALHLTPDTSKRIIMKDVFKHDWFKTGSKKKKKKTKSPKEKTDHRERSKSTQSKSSQSQS